MLGKRDQGVLSPELRTRVVGKQQGNNRALKVLTGRQELILAAVTQNNESVLGLAVLNTGAPLVITDQCLREFGRKRVSYEMRLSDIRETHIYSFPNDISHQIEISFKDVDLSPHNFYFDQLSVAQAFCAIIDSRI